MNEKLTASLDEPAARQLAPRVPPMEMLAYIHALMSVPRQQLKPDAALALAERQWVGQGAIAEAALLRWGALNVAFGDKRLETWTARESGDRMQISAALVAAAGIAPLSVGGEAPAFDIPSLLDATLELAPVAGNA
jgi:hypothetical protein